MKLLNYWWPMKCKDSLLSYPLLQLVIFSTLRIKEMRLCHLLSLKRKGIAELQSGGRQNVLKSRKENEYGNRPRLIKSMKEMLEAVKDAEKYGVVRSAVGQEWKLSRMKTKYAKCSALSREFRRSGKRTLQGNSQLPPYDNIYELRKDNDRDDPPAVMESRATVLSEDINEEDSQVKFPEKVANRSWAQHLQEYLGKQDDILMEVLSKIWKWN